MSVPTFFNAWPPRRRLRLLPVLLLTGALLTVRLSVAESSAAEAGQTAAQPAAAQASSSQPAVTEPLVWLPATVAEGTASRWYRCVVSQPQRPAEARLVVAADGVCSVYLNGQRLLKQTTLTAAPEGLQALGWDVTGLLRSGRNCVAVEVHAPGKSVLTAVGLFVQQAGQSPAPLTGEWKAAAAAPPVGWQQTDFNDRDWPRAEALNAAPAGAFTVRPPMSWQAAVIPSAAARRPFQWRDGDHVVLLGSTFLEREQQFGHIEAGLSGAAGTHRVTFRNLGWDGDTVFAESRGIFDAPEVGYLRMVEHVRAEEPSVILVCFGQNDVLTSGRTLEQFTAQLRRLLDDLSSTGAVIVLVSPHELLPAVAPIPSPSRFNSRLAAVTDAVRGVASERSLTFVDLFHDFTRQLIAADRLLPVDSTQPGLPADPLLHPDLWAAAAARWTDNGMHFNDRGYHAAALVVRERLLSVPAARPLVQIDSREKTVVGTAAEVRNVQWHPSAQELLRFEVRAAQLSSLPVTLQFRGEQADDVRVGSVTAGDQTEPLLAVSTPPDAQPGAAAAEPLQLSVPADPRYQQLLQAVVRKNELYFHRWRPQNITYLFGFRKHEQGNNAVEIAQFDPLVKALEDQIHALQQPGWRTVVIANGQPADTDAR